MPTLAIILAAVSVLFSITGPVNTWKIFKPGNKPALIPEEGQPSNENAKTDRLIVRLLTSPYILSPLNIVYNVWIIIRLMSHSGTASTWFVFDLSTSIAIISFHLLWMLVSRLNKTNDDRLTRWQNVMVKQIAAQSQVTKLIGDVVSNESSSLKLTEDMLVSIGELTNNQQVIVKAINELAKPN